MVIRDNERLFITLKTAVEATAVSLYFINNFRIKIKGRKRHRYYKKKKFFLFYIYVIFGKSSGRRFRRREIMSRFKKN